MVEHFYWQMLEEPSLDARLITGVDHKMCFLLFLLFHIPQHALHFYSASCEFFMCYFDTNLDRRLSYDSANLS